MLHLRRIAPVVSRASLDATDHEIVSLLVQDARRTTADIAARVGLSPSPVKRRIDRLERLGIIQGYTAVVDESHTPAAFEAFAEVTYAGNTDVATITGSATSIPEVIAVYTVAGDPDALVHFRVENAQHLHQLIDRIRHEPHVRSTKTLMVLDSWRRNSPAPVSKRPGPATRDERARGS